jgi:uncharacterized protein YqjF (DUF2071 family)
VTIATLPATVSLSTQILRDGPITWLYGHIVHQAPSTAQRFVVQTATGSFTAIIPYALRRQRTVRKGQAVLLRGTLRKRQTAQGAFHEILVNQIVATGTPDGN